jgi:hypothetical protein
MRSPDYGARVIDILPLIGDADSSESVVALFRAAVAGLGADAGVFMSYLRDDATRASYRSQRWLRSFEHEPGVR